MHAVAIACSKQADFSCSWTSSQMLTPGKTGVANAPLIPFSLFSHSTLLLYKAALSYTSLW